MSNLSYLCASDFNRIYPSFENPEFKPEQHTVACCVEGVPLLWIAMFRPDDLREAQFQVTRDGGEVDTLRAWAPLAPRQKALDQLKAAVPLLNRLFADWGALDQHAQFLEETVDDAKGDLLTIELEEIEVLHREGDFRRRFENALRYLVSPTNDDPEVRKDFVEVACLEREGGFPAADTLVEDADLDEEQEWNLSHLLGESHMRPVTWD